MRGTISNIKAYLNFRARICKIWVDTARLPIVANYNVAFNDLSTNPISLQALIT
jgi:hypothetical protein